MHILDIAQNSVRAGAVLVEVGLAENTAAKTLVLSVQDNGCGMDEEMLQKVTDPFVTSRNTRKVGLGLPFLKMAAELTGGILAIESTPGKGTRVTARFTLGHIDLAPLGNLGETAAALCAGSPNIDFVFRVEKDDRQFLLDTREVKQLLEGVSLSEPTVALFIRDYVNEHLEDLQNSQPEPEPAGI